METGVSPMIKLVISKSWIIISRNSPPETLIYSTGGGAGSKDVTDSNSALPICPAARLSRMAAKFGSNLRLKPIITGLPVSDTASRHALARSKLKSTGFSHITALPACVAASIKSECVSVEVAIKTALMASSAMISSELLTCA